MISRNIKTAKNNKDQNKDDMNEILQINQQYSKILKELAGQQEPNPKSSQAYLHQTLQNLQRLNKIIKKEQLIYSVIQNTQLQSFLYKNSLNNAQNLIGRFQETKDQLKHCRQMLDQYTQKSKNQQESQRMQAQQDQLQKRLKQLTARRINLVNKNQIISHQAQCGQKDLNVLKARNIEDEIKLRQHQKNSGKKQKR